MAAPYDVFLFPAAPVVNDVWLRANEAEDTAEAHSGTVLVHGGGTVAVLGQEGARRFVVVTGGGVSVVTARKAAFASLLVHGGGTVIATGKEGAARQVVVTGGGLVTATERTARAASVPVHGGGAVTVTGDAESGAVEGTVQVHGGGSVQVQGFRTGGATDSGGFGRTYRHQWATPEHHKGRVFVHGHGDLEVTGEKGALSEIEITGGGGADVYGDKRYPALYQTLITALAA